MEFTNEHKFRLADLQIGDIFYTKKQNKTYWPEIQYVTDKNSNRIRFQYKISDSNLAGVDVDYKKDTREVILVERNHPAPSWINIRLWRKPLSQGSNGRLCDYCSGQGEYAPFVGPFTTCPKCDGTGQYVGFNMN